MVEEQTGTVDSREQPLLQPFTICKSRKGPVHRLGRLTTPSLTVCRWDQVRPFADDPDSTTTASSGMRIIYHAAVARPRLLRWIASADALLNTSISEGTCNSMLEAMALRTLVIARQNAGNAELLLSGAYGFLFSTESELELLIRAAFASHESWHAVVEAAHEHVQAQRSLGQERRVWANILGVN